MSSYTEILEAIRAARLDRDTARSDLHNLLLQQLKLLRLQKRADRQEVVTDAATLSATAALRERMTTATERVRRIEDTLRELDQLEQSLQPEQALLAALTAEHGQLQASFARFERELEEPALSLAQ